MCLTETGVTGRRCAQFMEREESKVTFRFYNKLTDLGSDAHEAKWLKNFSHIGSKPF